MSEIKIHMAIGIKEGLAEDGFVYTTEEEDIDIDKITTEVKNRIESNVRILQEKKVVTKYIGTTHIQSGKH
jgi:hypothetical protein